MLTAITCGYLTLCRASLQQQRDGRQKTERTRRERHGSLSYTNMQSDKSKKSRWGQSRPNHCTCCKVVSDLISDRC